MPASDETVRRLQLAIDDLAAADLEGVLAQARADAKARVRALLAEAMAQSMLEHVQQRDAQADPPPPPPAPAPQRAPDPEPEPEPIVVPATGESAWYVYGVVAADRVDDGGPPHGIDPSRAVRTLREGPLAAVYSHVAVDEFDDARLRANLADMKWIEHVARTHESVLEWTQQRTTVVPMRMCTVYRDEAGVREMLRREVDAFSDALILLSGKDEWGVKVLIDPDAPRAPEAEEPSGESEPDAGSQYMRRRQRELEQAEHDAQALEAAAGEIHEQLVAVAVDALVAPAQRPESSGYDAEMVLNGIYLVERRAAPAFHEQVETLDERYRGVGLRLVETGPWPAYNFVPNAIGAAW